MNTTVEKVGNEILDIVDECPGLTLEQDRWLSRRIKAALAATLEAKQSEQESDFRIGLFWSSSNPTNKVRCLTPHIGVVAEWEKREDFIEWVPYTDSPRAAVLNGWYATTAELAAIYDEMCAINKTPHKEQSFEQKRRLESLRVECVALHYRRITLATPRVPGSAA